MSERKRAYEPGKGVFLAVMVGAQECTHAVEYACRYANAQDGHVALLRVIEASHVAGWHGIEKLVKREARANAEEMLWSEARHVHDRTGKLPILYIEEGEMSDIIIRIIKENKDIVALVLASSLTSSNSEPLVKYFSGKGLSRLPVPLIIAPMSSELDL